MSCSSVVSSCGRRARAAGIPAAVARRTTNANLIVLGNSIAMYNPPIRVAEEFAMLDLISGGRLVAGFPVGSSPDAYGFVPATLR